jgi:hypothetical protein
LGGGAGFQEQPIPPGCLETLRLKNEDVIEMAAIVSASVAQITASLSG